ncbi:hypothetical protein RAA17_24255 [Komagataeibacter rhaeticus]|nr:hypothetical protein [Komagataeibacter rhaeticus]
MRNDLAYGEAKWNLLSVSTGNMEISTGWNIPGCSRIRTSTPAIRPALPDQCLSMG